MIIQEARPGWISNRVRKLLVVSAASVALGALVVISFWGTCKPDCQDMDFGAYYRAGAAVARGESPYTVDEHGPLGAYPYAPVYAFLFMPLSKLDYLWACRLWLALNWAATALAAWLAVKFVCPDRPYRRALPSLMVTLLATGAYVWANL